MPYDDMLHSWSIEIPTNTIGWKDIESLLDDASAKTKKPAPKKQQPLSIPGIHTVIFNRETGHTVILWEDGEKTIVRCMDGEHFEPYVGFCMAVAKRLFGSTSAAKKVMDDKNMDTVNARKEKERLERIRAQRELEERNHQRKIRSLKTRITNLGEALEALMDDGIKSLSAGDKDGDKELDESLKRLLEAFEEMKGDGANG